MAVLAHQPPHPIDVPNFEPVIFLAGPIQGATDWQRRAFEYLAKEEALQPNEGYLNIANPRRNYIDDSFDYGKQVAWEKAGLKRAAKHGAIIFWFAAQDPNEDYEAGRAYAQTSRIEFGRVLGWHDYNPGIKIALGIEPGYKGSERYYSSCAEEKALSVHRTLEAVCIDALTAVIEHKRGSF